MTKTVISAGKSQRAVLVGDGMSMAGTNIPSELQDRNNHGVRIAVETDVFPTLQGTGMQELVGLLSTL